MNNQKGFIQIPFLLQIIIYLAILSGAGYLGFKQYKNYQTETDESQKSAIEIKQLKKELEILRHKEEGQIQTAPTVSYRISNQLKEFIDFLENGLVDADIQCDVLANFNNIRAVHSDDPKIKIGWPDSSWEEQKNKCRSALSPLFLKHASLVAEPELQPLRKILTDYFEQAKSLGFYALDGGYEASIIDGRSRAIEKLRTEAREEIIRIKRLYDIRF